MNKHQKAYRMRRDLGLLNGGKTNIKRKGEECRENKIKVGICKKPR